MLLSLKDASLRQIAVELRRRAKRTCGGCGGYGIPAAMRNASTTATMVVGCRCKGTGYEHWDELERLAADMERLAEAGT